MIVALLHEDELRGIKVMAEVVSEALKHGFELSDEEVELIACATQWVEMVEADTQVEDKSDHR